MAAAQRLERQRLVDAVAPVWRQRVERALGRAGQRGAERIGVPQPIRLARERLRRAQEPWVSGAIGDDGRIERECRGVEPAPLERARQAERFRLAARVASRGARGGGGKHRAEQDCRPHRPSP
jgi:hypothetical protein